MQKLAICCCEDGSVAYKQLLHHVLPEEFAVHNSPAQQIYQDQKRDWWQWNAYRIAERQKANN